MPKHSGIVRGISARPYAAAQRGTLTSRGTVCSPSFTHIPTDRVQLLPNFPLSTEFWPTPHVSAFSSLASATPPVHDARTHRRKPLHEGPALSLDTQHLSATLAEVPPPGEGSPRGRTPRRSYGEPSRTSGPRSKLAGPTAASSSRKLERRSSSELTHRVKGLKGVLPPRGLYCSSRTHFGWLSRWEC